MDLLNKIESIDIKKNIKIDDFNGKIIINDNNYKNNIFKPLVDQIYNKNGDKI